MTSNRRAYTEEEIALILDPRLTLEELAEQTGRTRASLATRAGRMKKKGLPVPNRRLGSSRPSLRRPFDPSDPSDPRHGTENGYSNLDCRCPRCTAAHADYYLVRRRTGPTGCVAPTPTPCPEPTFSGGLCYAHYARSRRGARMDTPVRPLPATRRVLTAQEAS